MRNFKKIGAYLTLIPIMGGMILFIWGAATSYSDLRAQVEKKADNKRVNSLEYKIDKILFGLCLIDKKTCVLKKED